MIDIGNTYVSAKKISVQRVRKFVPIYRILCLHRQQLQKICICVTETSIQFGSPAVRTESELIAAELSFGSPAVRTESEFIAAGLLMAWCLNIRATAMLLTSVCFLAAITRGRIHTLVISLAVTAFCVRV